MDLSWNFTCLVGYILISIVIAQQCQAPDLQSCSSCYYQGAATLSTTQANQNSYIVIGGLFDIHKIGNNAFCGTEYSEEGLINSLAFFWAINTKKTLITSKGVSVGATAFDTCSRTEQSIENMLGYAQCKIKIPQLSHNNLVAYIGPYMEEDAIRTGNLASDLSITLLSPTANSLDLSAEQSSLLRLRPSLEYDLKAIQAFLNHINTDFVMILYSGSDAYWRDAYTRLREMLAFNSSGLCVQFEQNVDELTSNIDEFVSDQLKQRIKSKYVISLMSKEKLDVLLTSISRDGFVSGELRFLFTSNIGRDSSFLKSKNLAANNAIVLDFDFGTHYMRELQDFTQYLNSGVHDLPDVNNPWVENFKLSGRRFQELNSQTRSPLIASVIRTIAGVDTIIKGMDAGMNMCDQQGANYQFCDSLRSQTFRMNNLYNYIKGAYGQFQPNSGQLNAAEVNFNYYVFVNNVNETFHKIGSFSGVNSNGSFNGNWRLAFGSAFSPAECPRLGECCEAPSTVAPSTTPDSAAPTTPPAPVQFSLVKYRQGQEITGAFPAEDQEVHREEWGTRFDNDQRWVIALGVLAGLGLLSCIVFEIYILYRLLGTRMGHKWRTMWLGQLLLFGIFLSYLVLFAFIFIPTKATCGITRFGVGVSYAVCFAVLLVKLMVILTSKTSDNALLPGDESPNYLKGVYQFLMFVFAVGVQIVIDVQWLITVPPEAVQVTSNDGSRVWVCNHYTWDADKGMDDMSTFVRTNFENHVLSLVYIMFLILITTLLSLNAHGIITNHRESVFIGISAGFSIPIWLAWGLVGGLNKDDGHAQEFGDACIAFGLFLTVTLILFSMFLPKVRQLVNMGVEGIYLEDDRETYYAGSVIMAPSSYKSKGANSVIYVNNQGIYSEPVIVGNGEPTHHFNGDPNSTHLKHPLSTYSAPLNPAYLKKAESAYGSTKVLRVTDDLSGKLRKKPQSEMAFGSHRPRSNSAHGTLTRSRSQTSLGAL